MGTNKIYGYCRVSTRKQSLERQERNILKDFEDAIIIKEEFTGKTLARPKWASLCSKVKKGDKLIFDSVSRMSRDAEDGFNIYEMLFEKGVDLVFLKQPYINTDVYRHALKKEVPLTNTDIDLVLEGINRYFMALAKEQIRLAFKEAENELIHIQQRTKEGIETARLEGKRIGTQKGTKLNVRKKTPCKQLIRKYCKDFDGSLNDKDTMSVLDGCMVEIATKNGKTRKISAHLSRNTYYRYKKQIFEEMNTDKCDERRKR